MELIRLEDITKTYRLGEIDVPVLKGISLTIHRGEMVALMGASGSGKTTLMNILGCLDRPSSGQFWFEGQEMSRLSPDERAMVRTKRLGFVFQCFNLLPRTSALKNVLMPLDYAVQRATRGEARHTAEMILAQVGLADHMHHDPSQMSGGQQQRVAIARALINRPALLLADEPTGNLDSHTGQEILRMFQRLHGQGITVILVTHDAKVAGYADRTIHIADGLIEDNQHGRSGEGLQALADGHTSFPEAAKPMQGQHRFAPPHRGCGGGAASFAAYEAHTVALATAAATCAASPLQEAVPDIRLRHQAASSQVKPQSPAVGSLIPPTLRTALGNLRANKMRSALTALGVIIGVGAVIAMSEIGQGSKAEIEKTIAAMGAYMLPIIPGAANNRGVSQGAGTFQTLKPSDVDEIARQCPAVSAAVPMIWSQAQVVYGEHNWSVLRLKGTAPSFLAISDLEDLEEGDCFTDDDVRTWNTVCLIGATVKRELFEDESPIGKVVRIRDVPFRVIGLLSPRGANMWGEDQDDCIVAPWTTIKFRVNSSGAGSTYVRMEPNVDFILAKAASAELAPVAIEQITSLLRERHHLAADKENDFKILDLTEIAQASARTAELMSALLLIVAAISLVVGGVGIMNIMLVAVTERIREIGLRMAVGARRHHILQQFLLEAVLLCLVGGALGILVGRGTSILVRKFQQWTTEVSLPAIMISVLVAAGVGIVFGFYPAWKASQLDPIEALRHE
jgi:macrolide transport system ATP-binding/permease protein